METKETVDTKKLKAYRAGLWAVKVPPVCTVYWDDAAWIDWIDKCNGWTAESLTETLDKVRGEL